MAHKLLKEGIAILLLNQKDIEDNIIYDEIIAKVEEAYKLYNNKQFYMPERISVNYRNKSVVYMPCFRDNIFGTKILTIFPENKNIGKPTINGLVLLNDYVTGEPLALLDGKVVTSLRTGAVGAVGIRYLARKDCTTVGIIGAGVQGFNQALFACMVRDIRRIYIYDKFKKDYDQFISGLQAKLKRPVEISSSVKKWSSFWRQVRSSSRLPPLQENQLFQMILIY